MNKQDKLFDLLKRNGWEQKDTLECEGIDCLFKIYEYHESTAKDDCFYTLGRLDALDVKYKHIYVQKEGPCYAAYLEF